MQIYEDYDSERCRRFSESEFEKEKEKRAREGKTFADLYYVLDEDAMRLGDSPLISDVSDCALEPDDISEIEDLEDLEEIDNEGYEEDIY